MKRRARLVVLCAAGVTASVVAGALIAKWPALVAEYHASRLERASTYAEAKPLFADLEDDAARGASGALLSRLHAGNSFTSLWLFAYLRDEGSKGPLALAFAERLRSKEELMRLWSHFVRWRRGGELLSTLDSMSPDQETVVTTSTPRCGTMTPGTVTVDSGGEAGTVTINWSVNSVNAQSPLDTREDLDSLAVCWFLGMPLPAPGESAAKRLGEWLKGSEPFLRSTVYDEKLGRCKREDESDPLPETVPFAKRGLPEPKVPLPGWEGPVPELPGLSQVQFETLIVPGSQYRNLRSGRRSTASPRAADE